MNATPTLDDRKRDLSALLNRIGLERAGPHGICCFCGDKTGMSVSQADDGVALFKCHSCGSAGTVIDAVMKGENISQADAIRRLNVAITPRSYAPKTPAKPTPRPESPVPIPDAKRVYDAFFPAFENIVTARANDRLKARGIHSVEWFHQHPILGWDARLNAWILLVTDAKWNYLGLKIHREKPFEGSKNFWLKCGTTPVEQPRHAALTFWPPVEVFDVDETLFLFPGELKAAAALSDGLNATSTTAGESHRWTPGEIERFRGREICLMFDDDPAGHNYRDATRTALFGVVREFHTITAGKKNA